MTSDNIIAEALSMGMDKIATALDNVAEQIACGSRS